MRVHLDITMFERPGIIVATQLAVLNDCDHLYVILMCSGPEWLLSNLQI